jgi:hypothetical protein
LLRGTNEERYVLEHDSWWAPITYRPSVDERWEDWLASSKIADFVPILQVTNVTGDQFYAAGGVYNWEEPEDALRYGAAGRKRLDLWFDLYLLRRDRRQELMRKLSEVDSPPEPLQLYQLFLGEYPWSPAWHALEKLHRSEDRLVQRGVRIASHIYLVDGSRGDFAVEETFSFRIPSSEIVRALSLARCGEASWCGQSNSITAFDPSVTTRGPSTLLLSRDAMLALASNPDFEPIWVVGGEQMIVSSRGKSGPGFSRLFGIYEFQDNALVGNVSRQYERYS